MKNRNRIGSFLCAAFLIGALAAGCADKDSKPPQDGVGGADTANIQDDADTEGSKPLSDAAQDSGDSDMSSGAAGTDGAGEQGGDAGTLIGSASKLGSLVEFSAETLDGGTFTQEDIRNKDVTVINFWSLTCGPCIVEMPDLAAFEKALPDNVQVVTVCFDGAWAPDETRELLEDCGFEGVTLIAFEGGLYEICRNIQYTPTTVFVDSEGNLVGDSIIGRQADLSETYLEAVNMVLRAGGKAEISLEE